MNVSCSSGWQHKRLCCQTVCKVKESRQKQKTFKDASCVQYCACCVVFCFLSGLFLVLLHDSTITLLKLRDSTSASCCVKMQGLLHILTCNAGSD